MTGTLIYGPDYVGVEDLAFGLGGEGLSNSRYEWESVKKVMLEWPDDSMVLCNVHKLYESCLDYICDRENCEHPSDMGVGKAGIWRMIKEELTDTLYQLSENVDEIILTCAMKKESVNHSFYTGDVYMPKLDWILEEIIPNIVDRTLAYLPVFKTVKTDVYAGDNTNKLPAQIKCGKTTKETVKILKGYLNA
jgi:hypothetical protein